MMINRINFSYYNDGLHYDWLIGVIRVDDKSVAIFVAVDHMSRVLTSERFDLTPPLL